MSGKKRVYRLVVTTRLGGTRLVYRDRRGRFSYKRGQSGRTRMTAPQIEQGKAWAKRRAARKVRVVGPQLWPFLVLADGARWPTNKRLLRALNATGQRRRRVIRIVSGLRTPHEAWELRQAWNRYQHGGPPANLAAPCCSKYGTSTTVHSWANCGRDPWSNHADGNAADCGTVTSGGTYRSLANDRKARRIFVDLGGCFPVTNPWEPWHCEMR